MTDETVLQWIVLLTLGLYLFIGLIIATRRFARRCRRGNLREDPDVPQFVIETLLWPAALMIDRPLW